MDVLKQYTQKMNSQKMKPKERDKSILEYVQCIYIVQCMHKLYIVQ